LAAGPSLQLGGQTFLFDLNSYTSAPPSPTYVSSKYQRIGWLLELDAEWNTKNPKLKNAASVSAFGADNTFPWYLNLTYKVRFDLAKN
jgi:hypothetical protein